MKSEKAALAVPFKGYFANAHEAPGRELNRLSAGEDGLDDIWRQEGELYGTADLAGVVSIAASDLPGRPDFASGQLAEPSMGPDEQNDEVCIWHRGFVLRARDNQLGLNTATLKQNRSRQVNQLLRLCRAVRGLSENSVPERGALERDPDRVGMEPDAMEQLVQQPTLSIVRAIVEVTCERSGTAQESIQSFCCRVGQVQRVDYS
jgi:hypothetical protein